MRGFILVVVLCVSRVSVGAPLSEDDKKLLSAIDKAYATQLDAYKDVLKRVRRNRVKPEEKKALFGTIKITGREMRLSVEKSIQALEGGDWAGPMPKMKNEVGAFGELPTTAKVIAKVDKDSIVTFTIEGVRTSGQLKGQVTFRTVLTQSNPRLMRGFDFSKTPTGRTTPLSSYYGVVTGLQRYGTQEVLVIEPLSVVVKRLRSAAKD